MDSRLERFRGYIARLEPAGDPKVAIERELYIPSPRRELADELALRLQLVPTSSHLVVGSVGAGKSTQLLLTAERLNRMTDVYAGYVDLSELYDLSAVSEGGLLVEAALLRVANLSSDKPFKESVSKLVTQGEGDGLLLLEDVWDVLPKSIEHFIVLFDALDRFTSASRFNGVIAEDLHALRTAHIGAVIVGPCPVIYGTNRSVVSSFDHIYSQPALDVANDPASRDFLEQVLIRRADEDVLPIVQRKALVALSGGVLRDLISLARSAVEEAFVMGVDKVSDEQVVRAADRFGRSMMLGLRTKELQKLEHLRLGGEFVPTSADELALIESRRVLEYSGTKTRYAVHPTIEPLLAAMGLSR